MNQQRPHLSEPAIMKPRLDEQLYAAHPDDTWECSGCDWTGTASDVRDAGGWCPRCDAVRPEPEQKRRRA